jgi:hypothetical protein
MNKVKTTIDFTVPYNGKVYKCTRTVNGEKSFTQTVTVAALGTKSDSAVYRNSDLGHSPETMHATAILLAMEIIKEKSEK